MKNKKMFMRQMMYLMPVFLNQLMFSCGSKWIPNVIFFFTKTNYQPPFTFSECTNIMCINNMGRLLVIIPGSFLPEKFGRKIIVMCCLFLHCFTWTILSTCKSIILIYILRFISGAAEGIFTITALTMIGEISSTEFRGTFICFFNIAFSIGELFACTLNAVFESYDILVNGAMILSFCCLPVLYWCIESPYFLIVAEKYEKAKHTLEIIRPNYNEEELNQEFEVLKQSSFVDKVQKDEISFFGLLKLKSIRHPLFCVIVINILVIGLGGRIMNAYMTVTLPPNDYVSNSTYPLVSCILSLISLTNTILLISKFSCRFLFIICSFLTFFTQSNNAVTCYLYYNAFGEQEFWKWSFIAGNFFYLTFNKIILSSVTDMIRAELLPYNVKGIGNGICIIFREIVAIILLKTYEICWQYSCIYVIFLIFAVNSVILILFVYLALPDTRGKSLIEIQNHFKKTDKKCNSEQTIC